MLPFVNAIVTLLHCIYLMQSLHHTLLDICKYLMMQSYLWQMVCMSATEENVLHIPEGSTRRGRGQAPRVNAPPPPPSHPPVSLEQLLATQNDLMRLLMENKMCHVADRLEPRQQDRDSSYSDFVVTHPPHFSEVMDPLEADNWLCTTKSKVWAAILQSIKKLCTQPNNSEAQQEPGGPPTPPHYQLIIKSHVVSSISPSVAIIYRRASCTTS
jgi:uncharacterized coiled-coil protein SlyX